MFVRLAFAVAINIDPEILIVDEALSVGDVFFQVKCYHKFEEFKKMGKTILFVSHDLGSISKYCDRVILLNKGHKVAEGEPKRIVDMYKQILVKQDQNLDVTKESPGKSEEQNQEEWKKDLLLNPDVVDYGEKKAEIVDFAIIDNKGKVTSNIEKGTEFEIRFKVNFHQTIEEPIFAFTIKDVQGTEITGTNTMYENIGSGTVKSGETRTVSFKQKMNLQGRNYVLALGCVGFNESRFVVYHRLYDVCNINVISDKNTVGFYDMDSKVEII